MNEYIHEPIVVCPHCQRDGGVYRYQTWAAINQSKLSTIKLFLAVVTLGFSLLVFGLYEPVRHMPTYRRCCGWCHSDWSMS